MITILSLKTFTGKATDAVDTVNQNIFNRISGDEIKFTQVKGFLNKIILIRKMRPEFILGIGNIEEILFVLLKPKTTRYVIAWHTLLNKTKAWPIRKKLFDLSSFVIAVSGCAGATIKRYFPDKKIFIALNGTDIDFFNPDRKNKDYLTKKYGINFNKPIVLFVGALFERKRPEIFIFITRKFKEANFILVGRKDKEDFLSNTKNIDNFQWIPFMNRNDVAIMMASSDIFLFPSINEPCAAVIPEAMASGLPVLLSRSCGNVELVDDDENGFLVDVGDNEKALFIKHLEKILNDNNLRADIGKKARKKCENELNWLAVSKIYKKIFFENL